MARADLIASLDEDLILDLTARLVEIPTRNPPGEEIGGAQFIHDRLLSWGVEAEIVEEPEPDRPQVVAWVRGSGAGPTVILNGHIDTVDEGDVESWSVAPFELTHRDNRLYGLGACDMKSSLALALAIVNALQVGGSDFPGTLMFQAVMGEEMDEDGTRTLLKLGYTGDYAIVLEPTDLRIGPATRGVTWHRVSLTGPSMHCGLAEPDSPDLMFGFSRLIRTLEEYHEEISARSHPLIPNPGCRITDVKAGGVHNDVVGSVEFTLDRRMIPGETRAQVEEELKDLLEAWLASFPDFTYEIDFLDWNEPTEAPLDSPLIAALQANTRTVRGTAAEIWGPPYGSDVRVFLYDEGIPAVNFGPGDFRVCHKPDEFVPLEDVMDCARIVMGAALDLLGAD